MARDEVSSMVVVNGRCTAAILGAVLVIAVAGPLAAGTPELDLALARLDSLTEFDIVTARQIVAFGDSALPAVLDRLDSPNEPTAMTAGVVIGKLGDRTLACSLLERWAGGSQTGRSLGTAIALKLIILAEGDSPKSVARQGDLSAERSLLDSVFCIGPSASLADTLDDPPLIIWVGFPGSESEWHLSCGAKIKNAVAAPAGDATNRSPSSARASFHCRTLTLDPDDCDLPASSGVLGAPPSDLAIVSVQELPLGTLSSTRLPMGGELWALCSGQWRFMQQIEQGGGEPGREPSN
jgi:hypothetical protein